MCSFVRMEVLSKKQRNILYVQLFHKNQSVVGAQRENASIGVEQASFLNEPELS